MKDLPPEVRSIGTISRLRRTMRVEVEKLDVLEHLIDQLADSDVFRVARPDEPGDRIEQSLLDLAEIARKLQDAVASVKKVHIGGIFSRMQRLVRELASKAEKRIELRFTGSEIEIDRVTASIVANSLVQLIRNCVDHGIETRMERRLAGKSSTATITLEAGIDDGVISIAVSDDGRGLNRSRLLKAARDMHLIQGDGEDMKDEDIWMLVLRPGISTAGNTSELSGRGIGLDIVRRDLEAIGGRLEISSESGKGTTVTLTFPKVCAEIHGRKDLSSEQQWT
jgi:two-component system chemotaxis sensor kinase CheA